MDPVVGCNLNFLSLLRVELHLAAHPSNHPPLIRAIHDITVIVKKVAQNPAVLAS